MFEQLKRRAEAGAGDAVRARLDVVADAFRQGVPGADVRVEEGAVVVRARGLVRRWLDDAALRAIGGGR